ncbi:4-hydroxyphenylpyruvate dioxygenase [Burkholderia sp. JPY481]
MTDFIPTTEICFVEFAVADAAALDAQLRAIGMTLVARHPSRALTLYAQGKILFIANAEPDTHASAFAAVHGNSVSAIGIGVPSSAQALVAAARVGMGRHDGPLRQSFDAPALGGIGGSLLYLVDEAAMGAILSGFGDVKPAVGAGLGRIDHITHCVAEGTMGRWVAFYELLFGFHVCFELEARGERTGFRTQAVKSPSGGVVVTVLEPTEPASQIQEFIDEYHGEGIQHMALSTDDIYASVATLRANHVDFLKTPDTYYGGLEARVPGHGEPVDRLKQLGILLDGSDKGEAPGEPGGTLLQIFTKKMIGPIFFEIIQRKGNEGFGNGNAKALFDAIEKEQVAPGANA